MGVRVNDSRISLPACSHGQPEEGTLHHERRVAKHPLVVLLSETCVRCVKTIIALITISINFIQKVYLNDALTPGSINALE